MNKDFNKKIMLDNINFLLNKKNRKIGELEKAAGVSPGYISRISKGDSTGKPGIEFITRAAYALGVSIDTFLRIDLSCLNSTERYFIDFIEKLTSDTLQDKLYWIREPRSELVLKEGEEDRDDSWYANHPLFSSTISPRVAEDGEILEEYAPLFMSKAYGYDTRIIGDCFKMRMKNDSTLHLMNICKAGARPGDTGAFAKELWISQTSKKEPQYLCGDKGDNKFPQIHVLYRTVKENDEHPKVTEDIRVIIDDFMSKIEENWNFSKEPWAKPFQGGGYKIIFQKSKDKAAIDEEQAPEENDQSD